MSETLLTVDLPGIQKLKSGKVREIFELGDSYLFVATDRISAFDCVMPNGIPRKGEVLTQISHFWFDLVEGIVPNHRLAKAGEPLPAKLQPYAGQLEGRSMIVKKAQPLTIEARILTSSIRLFSRLSCTASEVAIHCFINCGAAAKGSVTLVMSSLLCSGCADMTRQRRSIVTWRANKFRGDGFLR